MSDVVWNPKDRFSQDGANLLAADSTYKILFEICVMSRKLQNLCSFQSSTHISNKVCSLYYCLLLSYSMLLQFVSLLFQFYTDYMAVRYPRLLHQIRQ